MKKKRKRKTLKKKPKKVKCVACGDTKKNSKGGICICSQGIR